MNPRRGLSCHPHRLPRVRASVRGLKLLGAYVTRFEAPVLLAVLRGRASDTQECERLLARLTHRVFTEGLRRAGLTLDTGGGLPLPAPDRPVLLLMRHSGPLNFHLAGLLGCHLLGRGLLSVGRTLPGLDPAVGLLVRRLRVDLIRWNRSGPARAMRVLIHHSRDMGLRDVLAYFPEGVNMTAAGRRRSLAALDRADPERARWARKLRHVLPPVSAGAARVLSQATEADVLVVGHTGLEDLVGGVVDIGYPPPPVDDRRIHLTWWHTRAEDVPREPAAAAAWLDGQWAAMDEWIARKRGAPGPAPEEVPAPDVPYTPDIPCTPDVPYDPYIRNRTPVGGPGHD
ncbi:hypothetical protein [Streptomyces sp. NPDC048442]|uniref:hypothetical protein n=1 Tax=Streptomyces sp. NPDC048442 TaxID=3154823 RepID=UPI00342E2422